ncbi:MAG TPA: VTT domain-containing protein [Candidatus Sulfotelmatobacter sp.]|nr:VTT domain-containing protein [Candidatus Sulfotelmatobacter sp.]
MLNFLQTQLARTPRRPPTRTFASTLRHLGALGLFFLAILDSSPIPTFGGPDILTAILSASHRDPWYEYAATATAGSVLGAYLTFRVARHAGSAYLDKKFKKSKLAKFLKLFKRWGSGTLAASAAIPIPTPTSMFFAAAGASDYPLGKFLVIVTIARAVRYSAIAFVADRYGRHFLRVLRHPMQYWGWMLLFVTLTIALIAGGILLSRRLETSSV